tara:strand:- start:675 stop:881 length:207 start_codon:yes stop_codon:yes gene_type:complete
MPETGCCKWFKISPEIIRQAIMLCVPFSLSLRNLKGLLHERDICVSHEAALLWSKTVGSTLRSEAAEK